MTEQEQRTYNSRQLAEKLRSERQIHLSPDRIRRVLKKRGEFGNVPLISHRRKHNLAEKAVKLADLGLLKIAEAEGLIHLKYLDESGFCLWSPVSYSYVKKGEQKRLEQTPRRGRRLSILALWSPRVSFEYGLAIGSFTSETYIKVMDWLFRAGPFASG
jgi:hypothetical protein